MNTTSRVDPTDNPLATMVSTGSQPGIPLRNDPTSGILQSNQLDVEAIQAMRDSAYGTINEYPTAPDALRTLISPDPTLEPEVVSREIRLRTGQGFVIPGRIEVSVNVRYMPRSDDMTPGEHDFLEQYQRRLHELALRMEGELTDLFTRELQEANSRPQPTLPGLQAIRAVDPATLRNSIGGYTLRDNAMLSYERVPVLLSTPRPEEE